MTQVNIYRLASHLKLIYCTYSTFTVDGRFRISEIPHQYKAWRYHIKPFYDEFLMIFLAGPPTAGCQDRVSPAMETLASGDHSQPKINLSALPILLHFFDHPDQKGTRKLPPAWEEREEYDSLAPLPVIPRSDWLYDFKSWWKIRFFLFSGCEQSAGLPGWHQGDQMQLGAWASRRTEAD